MLNGYTELTASGKFSSGKGGENILVDIIAKGFTEEGLGSPEEAAQTVAGAWKGRQYLALKNQAWSRLQAYYADITK